MSISRVIKTQGFRNSAWSLFGAVIYPILVLLITPFFLTKLGVEQFGIWILINTTLQLISALNFGLGDAIINFVSKESVNEDHKELNKTISISLFLTSAISVVVVAVGLTLIYFNREYNWFNISNANNSLATDCLQLALFIFVIKFFDLILLSVFQGFTRYDLSSKFSLFSRVLVLSSNFVCLQIGLNLYAIFIGTIAIQLICLLIEIITVKKLYPFLILSLSVNLKGLRKIFNFGIWSWLQSLLAVITTQIDKLIIASFSGMEVLSYYSLGSMMAMQIHSILVSVSSWVFPAVAKKSEKGASLKIFFFNANALLLMLGFGSIVSVLLLQKPIFTLWLGAETYSKASVYIQLFLFYNLFLLPNIIPYFFLNGAGFVRQNTVSEAILKSLNILAMIIFYTLMGSVGLVWGLIVSSAIATPIRLSLVQRLILKNGNKWFGFEGIVTSLCIVLFLEVENLFVKIILFIISLGAFYFIELKPSLIFTYFKKIKKGENLGEIE